MTYLTTDPHFVWKRIERRNKESGKWLREVVATQYITFVHACDSFLHEFV